MKLSKFVKRAKSESYCVVIHADDSGIWLGTRLALYNATELPYMEGKELVCFSSRNLAGITEPMEVLAASRIWIALSLP